MGFAAITTAVLITGAPVDSAPSTPVITVLSASVIDLRQQPVAPVAPLPLPADQQVSPPMPPVLPPLPAADPAPPLADATGTPIGQTDEVVVTGRSRRGDPLQALNVKVFDVSTDVDKAIVGPAALAYEKKVPAPLRNGLRNFLVNLREPIVFMNYLLQLKFGKAAETGGRFALNSTIGAAGLFDIAKRKPFHLPLRRNGFANTLGFYGIGTGPFFFLPLIGPTSLRDLIGTVVDQAVIPLQPIRPSNGLAYVVPVGILSALDYRARIEPDLTRQRATRDPYGALRREYLAKRQAEIEHLHGRTQAVTPGPSPTDK